MLQTILFKLFVNDQILISNYGFLVKLVVVANFIFGNLQFLQLWILDTRANCAIQLDSNLESPKDDIEDKSKPSPN